MQDPRSEALSFLKGRTTGVLATVSLDGTPHARTVYYAADDAFGVHFLTFANTRKSEDMAGDARAAFVVSSEEMPQTLQMEGYVSDLTETAETDAMVKELVGRFSAKGAHFAPITRLDPSSIRYYKLAPRWVRWGDFTQGDGSAEVLTEIAL